MKYFLNLDITIYNINKLLYLLIDRPDEFNKSGEFYWVNKNKDLYRDYDLPAVVLRKQIRWYNNQAVSFLNCIYVDNF